MGKMLAKVLSILGLPLADGSLCQIRNLFSNMHEDGVSTAIMTTLFFLARIIFLCSDLLYTSGEHWYYIWSSVNKREAEQRQFTQNEGLVRSLHGQGRGQAWAHPEQGIPFIHPGCRVRR